MTKSTITREQITAWMNDANYALEEPLNADDAAAARAILAMGDELLAAMDSEPVVYTDERNLGYIDRGRETAYLWGKQNSESEDVPLYRHAQQPTVGYVPLGDSPYDVPCSMPSNLREFIDQEIGILFSDDDAQGVWIACRRAAMLQAEPVTTANKLSNSPVIPDGLIAAVNHLLDSDGSRGCYSAIQCGDAHDEIERLLAAALQEEKTERKK
ncbi:TPA: hypothetical protein ACXNLX_004689 [Klebsiella aerogenes]